MKSGSRAGAGRSPARKIWLFSCLESTKNLIFLRPKLGLRWPATHATTVQSDWNFLSCRPFALSALPPLAAAQRRPFLGERHQPHAQTKLERAVPSPQWTNASIAIMLACGSVYLAERRLMLAPLIAPGAQKIRLLLLEAVLGISDGVEAVLSSAADALIQLLELLQ